MKRLITLITLLVALSVATVQANIITLNQGPYSYGQGGEFTAQTSDDGTFQTFCIETAVEFTPGHQYSYEFASTDSQGRYVALGTAYLYSQFITGQLSGYDYTSGPNHQKDAGALQQAIWYIQGGQTFNGVTPTILNNTYYADAFNKFGADDLISPNSIYNVEVLRMLDANGNPAQDQLATASIPEINTWVAASMMMLPLGLSIFRRRYPHINVL